MDGESRLDLMELVKHDGYRPMLKLMETIIQREKELFLNSPVVPERAESLVHNKCRLEGAEKFMVSFLARMAEFQ